MIKTIESLEQYTELIQKEDAVLFYFSHEQCNVCKILKPKIVSLIETQFPKVKFYYCNTKTLPDVAAQNQIFSVPTITIYFAGKESIRKSRNIGIEELKKEMERPYLMLFGA